MAKAGMRRPNPKAPHGTEGRQKMNIPKNNVAPVPELQGPCVEGISILTAAEIKADGAVKEISSGGKCLESYYARGG
jgi:hypothetical protein